jgi:hypothetical protein
MQRLVEIAREVLFLDDLDRKNKNMRVEGSR